MSNDLAINLISGIFGAAIVLIFRELFTWKEQQYIEKADEIIKNAEEKKVRTPIFGLSGGWSQYYQEKARILRKVEEVSY